MRPVDRVQHLGLAPMMRMRLSQSRRFSYISLRRDRLDVVGRELEHGS
jgi:hypothetical protein